jgi:hypothetical protein
MAERKWMSIDEKISSARNGSHVESGHAYPARIVRAFSV